VNAETVVVDARDLRCPLPVIELARAAANQPAGAVLQLLCTDPAARHDVPAWARLRGHEWLVTSQDDDGLLRISVRLGPASA
jgi:tRNA 2-thiouridine synthesizing protein A